MRQRPHTALHENNESCFVASHCRWHRHNVGGAWGMVLLLLVEIGVHSQNSRVLIQNSQKNFRVHVPSFPDWYLGSDYN